MAHRHGGDSATSLALHIPAESHRGHHVGRGRCHGGVSGNATHALHALTAHAAFVSGAGHDGRGGDGCTHAVGVHGHASSGRSGVDGNPILSAGVAVEGFGGGGVGFAALGDDETAEGANEGGVATHAGDVGAAGCGCELREHN